MLSICLSGEACDEALKAYYYERPLIQKNIKKIKNKVTYYIGDTIVSAVPPLYLATQNKAVSIKINKQLTIRTGDDNMFLVYVKDF